MLVKRVKNFLNYKFLLYELVNKDLKIKYRRSILGYAWSLLNPLLMMLVITAIFSNIFRYNIDNFPLYLMSGQVIFTFYSDATMGAMGSIVNSSALIKKVYIPKYIFPLSKVCFSFINMLFSLIALLIVIIVTKTPLSLTMLLLPIPLFYIFLVSLGMGLILSVITTYFRDMLHLYSVFITVLMYFTPIFYPISAIPESIQSLIQFNPLYHIINYVRDLVLYQTMPTFYQNIICFSYGLVLVVVGLILFRKHQKNFILYI